jgi:DNA-binding XRE family transcriptional regulator
MKQKTITLREARERKGWTIAELAQASGIGWATVQAIEAGRMPGSIITRHRLSDALGLPLRAIWPDSMKALAELRAILKEKGRP